jgi:hypothetical protein
MTGELIPAAPDVACALRFLDCSRSALKTAVDFSAVARGGTN